MQSVIKRRTIDYYVFGKTYKALSDAVGVQIREKCKAKKKKKIASSLVLMLKYMRFKSEVYLSLRGKKVYDFLSSSSGMWNRYLQVHQK